ncbi:formimidoylglutamate deiminase [Nannocystis sp. ILAH1]|uniref:formimidoylglutamate deiminase n=1 Tax=Nannocystis sp. ILAH1 TaxID=2996789 RepID=UPI00226DE988|nr:formimidoylglutamate deiminase [Nannocystis sp. ILAH1]MCY0988256.1 formimidoylglutamate deiminase [Nannocystis sp. ILAH1]
MSEATLDDRVGYLAAWGLLGDRWVERPYVEVDGRGVIVRTASGRPADAPTIVHDLGRRLLYPGLVNAHSHAFQRAIRGGTHRRGEGDPSSFWSWREAMYRVASSLGPDEVYAVTRRCYAEMLRAGITCVGEFHYLHHAPDGTPYADANELSRQVLRAGAEVGIRVVLLEVYYARAGADRPPLAEQRRFCDGTVDRYLARVDTLRGEGHTIGLAPHSVRAVPLAALSELAAYARAHDLVIHAHVSEQGRENEECRAEHGRTPTEVFADAGCLARPGSFTAVHAIHLEDHDHELLAGHNVCACPTTEADLGDGIIPAPRHRQHGTGLALGSDSNAVIDLVQEARLLEMHERLRAQARLCLAGPDPVGRTLLDIATVGGARALGRPELGRLVPGTPFDACAADLDHPHLADLPDDQAHDALWLSGTAAAIDRVFVGGVRRR